MALPRSLLEGLVFVQETTPKSRSWKQPLRRRPRLLLALGYAGRGRETFGITGIERKTIFLLEGFAPVFETYVAYPPVGQLFEEYEPKAQAMFVPEVASYFDRSYISQLCAFLVQNDIDLVLSMGMRIDFHVAQACRKTNVPQVVHRPVALADERMSAWRKWLFSLPDSWTLSQCRRIIACSRASADRMLKSQRIGADKIVVVPNGVDLPRASPGAAAASRQRLRIAADSFVFGGVGQLIQRKAFDHLIEAAASLRNVRDVAVVLIGDGPERQRLEATAKRLGVKLVLTGYVQKPYDLMAAFDLAVLPSRAEGMPHVVLEAMSLGIACVATNVAGTPEVIQDGESGLLVAPEDLRALTAALRSLMEDSGLRRRLAEAGRQRVLQHFSLQSMKQGYVDCLNEVLRP